MKDKLPQNPRRDQPCDTGPVRAASQPRREEPPRAARIRHSGLAVRNIVKTYNRDHVVNDLSFTLRRGETMALLGPKCAGKTTVLAMICGLTTVDRGQIILDDTDITDFSMYLRWRLGIGLLSRQPGSNRCLSVEQNVAMIIKHRFQDRATGNSFLDHLLEQFKLEHVRHLSPFRLPQADRARAEVARIMAGEPEFILFDEPFADVDSETVSVIQGLIRQCADLGAGILITGQHAATTLDFVDHALVIHQGSMLAEGVPAHIASSPEVLTVLHADRDIV